MIDLPDIQWSDPDQEPFKNPARTDLYKALYQAKLEEEKAKQDAIRQALHDAQADDYTRGQALYSAYLDVAKGQIDRSQTRAAFIAQAAGGITTLYTGLAALAYGLGQGNHVLPIRGLIPAVFLGGAIVLATVYLAFITRPHSIYTAKPSGLLSLQMIEARDDFIRWTSAIVGRRIHWLHAAVISLSFGVASLPLAFINISDGGAWLLVIPCAAGILAPLLVGTRKASNAQDKRQGKVSPGQNTADEPPINKETDR